MNQLKETQIEEATILTWGLKGLAMTLLIGLNAFFIFSCMLYGRDKGGV